MNSAQRAAKLKGRYIKACKKCDGQRADCIDTRIISDGRVRRRYRCRKCKNSWSTVEDRFNGRRMQLGRGGAAKAYDSQQRAKYRKEFQDELKKALGWLPTLAGR